MIPPLKIDHLGIAVASIEKTLPLYEGPIGLKVIHEEVIADQKVRAVFLQVGESTVELLEPTSPDSPIAVFLEKKGPGIHHVAYAVEDIAAKLAEAKAAGIRLIDEQPRPGGHGKMIAFLHPKDTFGVLTEYCQRIE
ncbi:methylmalonyl-CoA epimerase [Effusibacillus dendaii]|uniref:Methylmalonyl-CoA epimerase n=1 Tax=Effusibacillus dendaii TaxID=2743772 RepID=A0A7I8D909_9BACL|nr:methylmalonyl-CoA epimerase [Effusibacillus dendaii]BCJ85842.1 methylmalonyl-CoA epimerase [Effusibacillus dendaii]